MLKGKICPFEFPWSVPKSPIAHNSFPVEEEEFENTGIKFDQLCGMLLLLYRVSNLILVYCL